MIPADDRRPLTPVSIQSRYRLNGLFQPKPIVAQNHVSPPSEADSLPSSEAPLPPSIPTREVKQSVLGQLHNAKPSTAAAPIRRSRPALRPHPRKTTVAFGRTTPVVNRRDEGRSPSAQRQCVQPKTPKTTKTLATSGICCSRQTMMHEKEQQIMKAVDEKMEKLEKRHKTETAALEKKITDLEQKLADRDTHWEKKMTDLTADFIKLSERMLEFSQRETAQSRVDAGDGNRREKQHRRRDLIDSMNVTDVPSTRPKVISDRLSTSEVARGNRDDDSDNENYRENRQYGGRHHRGGPQFSMVYREVQMRGSPPRHGRRSGNSVTTNVLNYIQNQKRNEANYERRVHPTVQEVEDDFEEDEENVFFADNGTTYDYGR